MLQTYNLNNANIKVVAYNFKNITTPLLILMVFTVFSKIFINGEYSY